MILRTALTIAFVSVSLFAHAAEEAHAPDAAAAPAAGEPSKGQTIAGSLCVGCHAADGNSAMAVNPILAGQIKEYIYKQLVNFKPVGDKPAARANPIMGGMVAALSDEDMKSLAAWFSAQAIKPAAAKDEKLVAAGQKLWRGGDQAKGIPACAGCHGPSGTGMPAQYPRLAGQYAEYTELQLKAFRSGERANDGEKVMRMIAAKMSDVEIKAVSEYAAALR